MPSPKKTISSPKRTIKKVNNKKVESELENSDVYKEKINKIADDMLVKVKELKSKFKKTDPQTKKKIFTGLSTAAAGIFALSKLKKNSDKKKNEKKD